MCHFRHEEWPISPCCISSDMRLNTYIHRESNEGYITVKFKSTIKLNSHVHRFNRPVANHWQTLSHNVLSNTFQHERMFEPSTLVVIGTDCTGNCKSNYYTITTTKVPLSDWMNAVKVLTNTTATITISEENLKMISDNSF